MENPAAGPATCVARIGSRTELRAWLRGPVRESIPHQAALVLHGGAHSLGFAIEERICVDLPEGYLAGISDPAGQVQCPVLAAWMRTREPRYFDLEAAPEDTDRRWLRNFEAHGLRSCALFGLVGDADRRVSFLCLYNVAGGGGRASADRCMPLLEHVHSTLVRMRPSGEAARQAEASDRLTPAEREVLRWVRLGKTNSEIGMILGRSRFTVKTHIQRMLAKTGLDNRTQLSDLAKHHAAAMPPG